MAIKVKKDKIKSSNDLFSYKEIDNTKDSVKESNNRVKSIIIIYENNKFEQIEWENESELSTTKRGDGGFGSTGIN